MSKENENCRAVKKKKLYQKAWAQPTIHAKYTGAITQVQPPTNEHSAKSFLTIFFKTYLLEPE